MYGKIERIFQFSKAFPFQVQEVVTCSNLGYNARATAQSISTWCDILYYYLCLKVTTPQQDAFMVTSDGNESDKCGYSICLPESVPATPAFAHPQPYPRAKSFAHASARRIPAGMGEPVTCKAMHTTVTTCPGKYCTIA
jgi:hypothetical protein